MSHGKRLSPVPSPFPSFKPLCGFGAGSGFEDAPCFALNPTFACLVVQVAQKVLDLVEDADLMGRLWIAEGQCRLDASGSVADDSLQTFCPGVLLDQTALSQTLEKVVPGRLRFVGGDTEVYQFFAPVVPDPPRQEQDRFLCIPAASTVSWALGYLAILAVELHVTIAALNRTGSECGHLSVHLRDDVADGCGRENRAERTMHLPAHRACGHARGHP